MDLKYIDLFEGLHKGVIPFDGTGYLMGARYNRNSAYTIIEVIAFKNVKQFIPEESGVTFYCDGYKTYILYEPNSYRFRFQEPYLREAQDAIPLRWNELDTIELPNHDRIHVSKEPYISMGNFHINKPDQGNFVYYFYQNQKPVTNMDNFLTKILAEDLGAPRSRLREVIDLFHKNVAFFQQQMKTDNDSESEGEKS